MQRRTFISASAAALTAGVTSACTAGDEASSSPSSSASSAPVRSTSANASGPVRAAADLKALAKDLDGTLTRPGQSAWAAARQLYNTRFDDLRPSAVAYAAGPDDLRTALAYARARKVPVAIRNGGHSYAGWSSGDGRLILDVSRMKTVRASGGEAVVGAGAKLIDVYRALAAKGVTIPAGSCPTVGISGLTPRPTRTCSGRCAARATASSAW
jgi:hypothetical protein